VGYTIGLHRLSKKPRASHESHNYSFLTGR
jgi:hypothetical protein